MTVSINYGTTAPATTTTVPAAISTTTATTNTVLLPVITIIKRRRRKLMLILLLLLNPSILKKMKERDVLYKYVLSKFKPHDLQTGPPTTLIKHALLRFIAGAARTGIMAFLGK